MRTVKEINEQIQTEYFRALQLQEQLDLCMKNINNLEREKIDAENNEREIWIDEWLMKTFGIKSQVEACRDLFIVFDKDANFIKTAPYGNGSLKDWLRENKLYAHRASSFCHRNFKWYQLTFKEQLETLGWKYDKNGNLVNNI